MSVINDMLRELDARRAEAAAMPTVPLPAVEPQARVGRKTIATAFALALLIGAAGAYFASDKQVVGPAPPPVEVSAASRIAVAESAPAVSPIPAPPPVSEPVQVIQAPVPVVAAAAPRPTSSGSRTQAPRTLAAASNRTAPALGMSTSIGAPPAATEPAVVKKVVELTPEAEAQQLHADALALHRAGKVETAIAKYQLALERNPGLRGARLELARLLQGAGRNDAALALLKAGYAHAPDGTLAIATGRLLADDGRREEALSWLERGGSALRPPDHALMGALHAQLQRHREAANAYEYALASEPQQAGWWLGLGLSLEALGRADEAQNAYRNALRHGSFEADVVRFLQQRTGQQGR